MTGEKTRVILHAEDEPVHAEIVRFAIQRNFGDVQLRHVGDGRAALDYLYRRGFYEDPSVCAATVKRHKAKIKGMLR